MMPLAALRRPLVTAALLAAAIHAPAAAQANAAEGKAALRRRRPR